MYRTNNNPLKSYPFKVYLFRDNSDEHEIRRFTIEFPDSDDFDHLILKIKEFFPGLSDKELTVYWEDEEGEKVVISSSAELNVAFKSRTMETVKKLYVKVKSHSTGRTSSKKDEDGPVHYGVYCDECNRNIKGIRYKCAKCDDYDLCSDCREADLHSKHPMYRISHPDVYVDLVFFGSEKHRSRRHSDGGKKKRRSDKRESGPETGDEMEDSHCGKHTHKKHKKAYKCPYSQLVNDFLGYFNPIHFPVRQPQNPRDEAGQGDGTETPPHVSYLRNLGSTLQKILDPLGVDVEFEVRPKEEPKKENKNEKDEKQPSASKPSTPPQKEVRFPTPESVPEMIKQNVEEITKILSNQTLSNSGDNDNGWVSFEELKRDSEEPKASSSAEAPKTSPTQASAPEEKKEEVNGNQNIYPNLNTNLPSNPVVRQALENMLAMGFTNEGNWLGSLLEAKNGDIIQALEALSFQKRSS